MIPVTKPFLPPIEEYQKMISGIWERNWLTNNGPLVQQLEQKLTEYLEVKHLLFTGNGTIALQMAIKVLGLTGEIITTPFSYVATTSSIVWEGCTPVFVDIDPETLNIDPKLIENAITNKTSAILATHVFGNPCEVEAIEIIAKKHGLKVIYDGAHAFGCTINGRSVLDYGDISVTSFHATKVFHTIEGGAVITRDDHVAKRISYMRNFGHDGPEKFNGVGINGKNSEFHAAMGMCNLRHIDEILQERKKTCERYNSLLIERNSRLKSIDLSLGNSAYYPIIFESEEQTIKTKSFLENNDIFPRRYFYPSLNRLEYNGDSPSMTISEEISSRILCLPVYQDITKEDQIIISNLILQNLDK
ncbi:DegT/DnrJ/EryC1/StrS family aminotransferase [Reichenbachiella sp. MALMAid0571]|uniref:DegT/DnrJ/EryC1/StrS family aminotransferase n=1 Tax=Reichenbachiella sp. MALMAid0571 TaxID=3143939 RepID=UPI0032DE819D